MKAPAFWNDPKPGILARLLKPAGLVYSLIAEMRIKAVTPARPLIPVICVGNPTLGGAGKTPVAIAIGKRLRERGLRPGFLSRGYGANITTPVIVERKGSAELYGDEPLLLARAGTTVCSPNRPWGAERLEKEGVGIIVMDDGFQNPSLSKDLSLLVVDAGSGLGNGLVFPAGPLRMRLAPQLMRADAIVIAGAGKAGAGISRMAERRGIPVLHAVLLPDPARTEKLRGRKLVAYAGIGRPEKFFATLRDEKLDIAETVSFADHHPYTPEDAARLLDLAKSHGATLVTTQKDAVRLAGQSDETLVLLARKSRVLPVEAVFDRVSTHKLNLLLDTLPNTVRKKVPGKRPGKAPAAKPAAKPKKS
ncbi:MAG: tetraacyldisaccharide 4'-kinase [Rhodobiaceae bacterium]|nr:tetraacyldisaccharide 4'-kinase [Rhodobiaceae bacterium]MCC0048998.1 tetraacyldisaccharide 4'-kinase [Rhodobiaceae bacterium]